MTDEKLELRYVAIATLEEWSGNPKRHSLPDIEESIRRFGFRDPPAFDQSLNGGRGGVVEGNGRAQVLRAMEAAGEAPPRGIALDPEGRWLAPVLFGIGARREAEAEAYGLTHNATVLGGSGLAFQDLLHLFDEEALQAVLRSMPDAGDLLVGFGTEDLDALLSPKFEPVGAEDQSRLDEREPIICPECGAEIPR